MTPFSLVPLRSAHSRDAVHSIRRVRAAGDIPLVGDDRWSDELWSSLCRTALTAGPQPGSAWGTFTSGSTGTPRIVLRTERSWADSFDAVSELLELTPRDTVYLPAPPASSLSLFGIAHTTAVGAHLALPSGHTVRAADFGAADVFHGTPRALQLIVDAIEQGAAHRFRVALVGGSDLSPVVRARAESAGIRVIAYYGAAELSFVAVDTGAGLEAFPGVELRVTDDELWVRSPFIASGYLTGSDSAPGPFAQEHGWATVGDRAEISNGYLRLRGRRDGAILTASATVIPGDVERELRACAGVGDVVVCGLDHPSIGQLVAAVIEPAGLGSAEHGSAGLGGAPRARPTLADLRETAARTLPPTHRPRRWFTMEQMPRTSSGKPARAEIEQRLRDGTVDAL